MRIKSNLQHKLGQNTAEYLILLILVSVGSIGIFTVFSGTLRKQLANTVAAFTGSTASIDVSSDAGEAAKRANKEASMKIDSEKGNEFAFPGKSQ